MRGPAGFSLGLLILPTKNVYYKAQALKARQLRHFFILKRFVLVKYSRAFVERPSQGTSSLASRLTTVSLDSIQVYG